MKGSILDLGLTAGPALVPNPQPINCSWYTTLLPWDSDAAKAIDRRAVT